MSRCGKSHRRRQPGCQKSHGRLLQSYGEVVRAYIKYDQERCTEEMEVYAEQPTLGKVIEMAALAKRRDGKKHDHQQLIPPRVLMEARKRLHPKALRSAADFDDLHNRVEKSIGWIDGIGELAVYDIAHRIGIWLDLEPDRVYLHRGTREGAKALGLNGRAIELDRFPREFRRLPPADVENCLCIYKADLKSIAAARVKSRRRPLRSCQSLSAGTS